MPLLLCHGGPGGYDYLEPVAALVDDLAEVHRFDQRGGGRSTPGGPWTVAALVDDMETLRRRFGHERWIVGGHSWGAHLALFYALAHPETAPFLFLFNAFMDFGDLFANEAQRRHFAEYLTGLYVADRKTVTKLLGTNGR